MAVAIDFFFPEILFSNIICQMCKKKKKKIAKVFIIEFVIIAEWWKQTKRPSIRNQFNNQ